jgi:Tol biopolymer transport system component
VYIRHIDSGETRPLQLPKGFDAIPTGWFPDSIHLLLSLRQAPGRPYGIWKVSILGGSPQELVENATEGVVSPDGSRIAFLRVDDSDAPELWLSGSDGSNPQRLVKVPGPKDSGSAPSLNGVQQYAGASISQPAWSPDGSRIAYIRGLWVGAFRLGEKSYYALESVDASGGPPKLLRNSPELLPTLTWAADGRLLYAENDDKTSELVDYGVWSIRVNPRSGDAEQKPVQLTTGAGRIRSLSTSADGKRLVVGRSNTQPEVYLAEIGRKTRELTAPHRLTLDQNGNIVSAWTPDSRAILFYSNRNGTWTLFRQAIDQVVPEVVVGGHTMFLPRLNPDGTQILYLTGYKPDDPARPVQVMKVPLQGGSPQVLLQKISLANAQCARSPSKLCLLDTFAGGSQEFFSFDSDTGETREFVKFSTTEFINWSLSPDGMQLAFILSPKAPKISFMAVSNKSTYEVEIKGAVGLGSIDWAGDGKSVFTSGTTSNGAPAVWNAEPGGTNRLVLEGDKHTAYWWVIPSPDGRYVALELITGENNVWMVENF